MPLFLGENQVQINLDGVVYELNLYTDPPITEGSKLISTDGSILQDSTGLYITTKKEEE